MSELRPCPLCGGSGQVLDDKAIGQAMRKMRVKAGLTGREVARRLKLSAAYVSDLELGRRAWNAARRHAYTEAIK
jgi:predicted transcriptional regulator